MKNYLVFTMATLLLGTACSSKKEHAEGFTGAPGEVKLITLDPGHFLQHWYKKSLIHKFPRMFMCTLPQVSM